MAVTQQQIVAQQMAAQQLAQQQLLQQQSMVAQVRGQTNITQIYELVIAVGQSTWHFKKLYHVYKHVYHVYKHVHHVYVTIFRWV